MNSGRGRKRLGCDKEMKWGGGKVEDKCRWAHVRGIPKGVEQIGKIIGE